MKNEENKKAAELIALASSVALYLSQDMSTEELNIFAAFFSAVGDNLGIIASLR